MALRNPRAVPPVDFRRPRNAVNALRVCEVTAELETPALLDRWWPAPLDGLLAAAVDPLLHRARRRTPRAARLPLARWRRGLNNQWVWTASCAAIERAADASQPTRIMHPGPLHWTAAGDPEAVTEMLSTLGQVGRDRALGRGRVASWSVRDCGPFGLEDMPALMWRVDGFISRPVPARAAVLLGLDPSTVDTVAGAIRPPYSVPPRNPDGTRDWRPVLAPWTRRPPAEAAGGAGRRAGS
jgi:hypothetical protein